MQTNLEDIGSQLGEEAVSKVVGDVEKFCDCEEQRIALSNEPGILRRKAELSILFEQQERIGERLRHAPPLGDLRRIRRKAIFSWIVTVLLAVAGFALTLLAFDPFQLGWKSYVYSVGIAVVTPYLVEKVLEKLATDMVLRVLTALACVAALTSLMLLAVIRGDLMAQQTNTSAPALISDDATPAPQDQPHSDFYGTTVPLLRIAMLLLSFAMELGAGLALYSALRFAPDTSEDWAGLRKERERVLAKMALLVEEIVVLQNEPRSFHFTFWRDFYGSLITHVLRSAMTKPLLLAAGLLLLPHLHAATSRPVDLIIAIDLTQSVATVGPDGQTDFQKNIDGVTRLLAQSPAGSHVTVIGITDRSFAQPYIVLSASVPVDQGYFGERLTSARGELVRVWKQRSSKLQPTFRQTDILGALFLTSQIFAEHEPPQRKMLVLFSDMRQNTAELNLESPSNSLNGESRWRIGVLTHPALTNVDVDAMGVDDAGRTTSYWLSLRQFWKSYVTAGGGSLKEFTVMRENHR